MRRRPDEFADKVALITGASRGVGFATAAALARRGCKVAISARGEPRLLQARDQLESMGAEVLAVAGDVGDWEDAKRLVYGTVDRFGGIDILVNNAGISMRGRFAELSEEVCTQTIRTNLLGSVYLSRLAANHLIRSRGSIVFISSIAGLFGLPGASTYCASKGALTGLSESLRLELIPEGVHVGVVYLGFTEHDPEKRILSADGTPVPPDRPAHYTQADAAERIVSMIRRRKKQLIMTPAGNLGAVLHRLAPGAVERVILWAQSSQWKVFQQFS